VPEMTFVVIAHCMFVQFSSSEQSITEHVICMAATT